MEKVQLSRFQKDVSAVIELVRLSEQPILITESGKSLVKIIPIPPNEDSWLGCMESMGKIVGDIVSSVDDPEIWEVLA
jgi:antitoxin (DNA-binding transcriptional repressor) of toxin-antitoxin stability system